MTGAALAANIRRMLEIAGMQEHYLLRLALSASRPRERHE
jgi:hypothetical protein